MGFELLQQRKSWNTQKHLDISPDLLRNLKWPHFHRPRHYQNLVQYPQSWMIRKMPENPVKLQHFKVKYKKHTMVSHPRFFMYGVFTHIYSQNCPNLGRYSIHEAYGHRYFFYTIQVLLGTKKPQLRAALLNASQKALLNVSSPSRFPYGPENAIMEFSHMCLTCYVL